MAFPIAIMSFNRPEYLAPVLLSIVNQAALVPDTDVYLFQDGYCSVDGSHVADPALIEECAAIFRKFLPGGHVVGSQKNLGVAQNFERAERMFFEKLSAPAAYFFEDDLILAPGYLQIMGKLIRFALQNRRIAYVAAYGDHHASLDEQQGSAGEIVEMRHKWGFGMTRRQWLAQQPLVERYLSIVRRNDYVNRDHDAIRRLYAELGFASPGTSQDAMKDVASAFLGTTKIMTRACFGKYIGEVGLHSTSLSFQEQGYAGTQLYTASPPELALPDEDTITGWIAHQGNFAKAALTAVKN